MSVDIFLCTYSEHCCTACTFVRSAGCPWLTCVSITACVFAFSYFPPCLFPFHSSLSLLSVVPSFHFHILSHFSFFLSPSLCLPILPLHTAMAQALQGSQQDTVVQNRHQGWCYSVKVQIWQKSSAPCSDQSGRNHPSSSRHCHPVLAAEHEARREAGLSVQE